MSGRNILVVDDDSKAVNRIVEVLESRGYAVFSSTTKASAVELCQKIHPALIYLNAILTDASGLEITRAIRAIDFMSDIPIIMLTEMEEEFSERYKTTYGIIGFLKKPIKEDDLVRKTETLVPPSADETGETEIGEDAGEESLDAGIELEESGEELAAEAAAFEAAGGTDYGEVEIDGTPEAGEGVDAGGPDVGEEAFRSFQQAEGLGEFIEEPLMEEPSWKEYTEPEADTGGTFELPEDEFGELPGTGQDKTPEATSPHVGAGFPREDIFATESAAGGGEPFGQPSAAERGPVDHEEPFVRPDIPEEEPFPEGGDFRAEEEATEFNVDEAIDAKIRSDVFGSPTGKGTGVMEHDLIEGGRKPSLVRNLLIIGTAVSSLAAILILWFFVDFGVRKETGPVGGSGGQVQTKSVPPQPVSPPVQPSGETMTPEEQKPSTPAAAGGPPPGPTADRGALQKPAAPTPQAPPAKPSGHIVSEKHLPRYSVQVGFFSVVENADSLYADLKRKQYDVFVVKEKNRRGGFGYRVLVGKYATQDEAARMLKKVQTNEQLDAVLYRRRS